MLPDVGEIIVKVVLFTFQFIVSERLSLFLYLWTEGKWPLKKKFEILLFFVSFPRLIFSVVISPNFNFTFVISIVLLVPFLWGWVRDEAIK